MNTKKHLSNFIVAFTVMLFVLSTVIVFLPLETLYGNISEFTFSPHYVWIIMACTTMAMSLICSVLASFVPSKVLQWILLAVEAVGICIYVQTLFLNNKIMEMMGENVPFEAKTILLNLLIWLAIFTAVILAGWLIRKSAGDRKLKEIMIITAVSLIIIQTSGLISSRLTLNEAELDKDSYLSTEGEFTLSPGRNVLYFILDTCDREYVEKALIEDPDVFKEFTGFTSYQNMTSKYSRTYPSLPYLLTGELCYFDMPYTEYIYQAHQNGTFLPDMHKNGTDIRLYTSKVFIDPSAYENVNNISSYDSRSISNISVGNLLKAMIRFGGYKGMPYLLKPYFYYTPDPINRNVVKSYPEDYFTLTNNDFEFYGRLLNKGVSIDSDFTSAFRLYHLFGPHPGCYMNENAEYDPSASQVQAARGDFLILSSYLRMLKEAGIYDNTAIIITADHGNQNESEDLVLHSPPCCIMLYKPIGADSEKLMEVSNAPVCHDDLFATVLDQLGIDSSSYTPGLAEHEEGEIRDRYYYYTAQRSWGSGEIALREYRISGDAADLSNWELTGNNWDIKYSENAVSGENLGDN